MAHYDCKKCGEFMGDCGCRFTATEKPISMSKFNVGDTVIANGRGIRPKGIVGTVLAIGPDFMELQLANGTRTDSSEYAYDLHYTAEEAPILMNNIEQAIVDVDTRMEMPPVNVRDLGVVADELLPQSEEFVKALLEHIENSGGSCDYYKVGIENPTTSTEKYVAECNDVIEALNMTYAEANMFKEIWRSAAARTLGKLKAGHDEIRGAEKIVFFANRNMIQKGR